MLLLAAAARAADVPPELGLLVVMKVLTYDAGFEQRVGDGAFLVLVPHATGQGDAARALVAAGTALPTKEMHGRALKFEAVSGDELPVLLGMRRTAAVLIPSGTPIEAARAFAKAAAKAQRYSVTLDEALMPAGIVVGVALKKGKAQVVLNMPAAKAIKAEFSQAVVKVARVIQ